MSCVTHRNKFKKIYIKIGQSLAETEYNSPSITSLSSKQNGLNTSTGGLVRPSQQEVFLTTTSAYV